MTTPTAPKEQPISIDTKVESRESIEAKLKGKHLTEKQLLNMGFEQFGFYGNERPADQESLPLFKDPQRQGYMFRRQDGVYMLYQ